MHVLQAYELEAAGFAMQLMHEVGVVTLDRWFGDFVATDWRYVERCYQTETLPDWKSCTSAIARWWRPRQSPS
jgi:hypothetical protein